MPRISRVMPCSFVVFVYMSTIGALFFSQQFVFGRRWRNFESIFSFCMMASTRISWVSFLRMWAVVVKKLRKDLKISVQQDPVIIMRRDLDEEIANFILYVPTVHPKSKIRIFFLYHSKGERHRWWNSDYRGLVQRSTGRCGFCSSRHESEVPKKFREVPKKGWHLVLPNYLHIMMMMRWEIWWELFYIRYSVIEHSAKSESIPQKRRYRAKKVRGFPPGPRTSSAIVSSRAVFVFTSCKVVICKNRLHKNKRFGKDRETTQMPCLRQKQRHRMKPALRTQQHAGEQPIFPLKRIRIHLTESSVL